MNAWVCYFLNIFKCPCYTFVVGCGLISTEAWVNCKGRSCGYVVDSDNCSGLPLLHWLSNNWHNAGITSYRTVTSNKECIRPHHQAQRNTSDQRAYTSGPENDNTQQYKCQVLPVQQDDV